MGQVVDPPKEVPVDSMGGGIPWGERRRGQRLRQGGFSGDGDGRSQPWPHAAWAAEPPLPTVLCPGQPAGRVTLRPQLCPRPPQRVATSQGAEAGTSQLAAFACVTSTRGAPVLVDRQERSFPYVTLTCPGSQCAQEKASVLLDHLYLDLPAQAGFQCSLELVRLGGLRDVAFIGPFVLGLVQPLCQGPVLVTWGGMSNFSSVPKDSHIHPGTQHTKTLLH